MTAKYLEIPINSQAASGTMDLVINSRTSTTLASGTNASLGLVATISAPGGTNTGYNAGVTNNIPASGGTGSACTVEATVSAGGVVTAISITTAGVDYTIGDVLTVNGAGGTNCTFTVVSTSNATFPAQVNDATANFLTTIAAGDTVYNGTVSVGEVLQVNSDILFTCTTGLFPTGGETYNVRKPKQLNSTGATFTARKVRVGDKIDNTTAGTNTTVSSVINETSLTMISDIFGTAGAFDDNFTISPKPDQVYDPAQTFLSTVTLDDVVDNTTDGITSTITAILDDFRITTASVAMFGDGDAYVLYDQSSVSNKMYNIDSIISTDRGGDNFTTLITLNSINTAADTVTITHSDQGTGRLVSAAIETALVRGAVGVNLPEPPGPAVARVLMPIFGGSQIIVETVVVG